MTIEAINGKGVNRARAVCDACGRDEVVTCDYRRGSGGAWAPDEGQAQKKLTQHGWSLVKGKLRCPTCEAKRKSEKVVDMTPKKKPAAEAPREPSARMVAAIVGLLEDTYDDNSKRYRNPTDTDKTIAEVIGDGCLWGWVASIREKEFGPDTRNQEVEDLRAEFKRLSADQERLTGELRKVGDAIADASKRLEAVV